MDREKLKEWRLIFGKLDWSVGTGALEGSRRPPALLPEGKNDAPAPTGQPGRDKVKCRMFKTEFLPHTADVRIRLEADTEEALFHAAAFALGELLKPGFCSRKKECSLHEVIELKSVNRTTLLVDFLSELLTLSYIRQAVFCELRVYQLSDNSISAKASGQPVEGFEEDIKAITYHEAHVQRNEQGRWETQIVVDI